MDSSWPPRKRNKKYNVPGHAHFLTFSCYRRMALLSNDTWRGWLAESVRKHCDEHQIALWAYVFMPEHVHLLLKPLREKSLMISDAVESPEFPSTDANIGVSGTL